jgi:hypothetical protein
MRQMLRQNDQKLPKEHMGTEELFIVKTAENTENVEQRRKGIILQRFPHLPLFILRLKIRFLI